MNIPVIPATAEDNRRVVEIYAMTCRAAGCPGTGPWLAEDEENSTDPGHEWHLAHYAATGHREYYRWQVSRMTARVRG